MQEERTPYDYLCVIWNKKIFIIVLTLVCIVIGVIMSLRISRTCNANVFVRIGMGMTTTKPTLLDEPTNMAAIIPIEYSSDIDTGYNIRVVVLKGTPMISIIVEGPEKRKAEELLQKVVEQVIVDHNNLTDEIIESYRVLARGLGGYIEAAGEEIAQFALTEEKIHDNVMSTEALHGLSNSLRSKRVNLMTLQRESEYKMKVNSLRTNRTKMVGSIVAKQVPVTLKKVKLVVASGVIGFSISLFLVCFIDYIKNAGRERCERKRVL
ncbi:MAG: hypothetical protein HOI47_20275 [Candidatus Scalindua sp.]|jgi:hypothetical protein|nr:hypothetical protein [Candidatus Scalindua sp.]MBT6228986.1 hypothetical protein [Candidatus Scalindua sp.]MBT6671614.1 hypothetical protein [Lentimicrobiaceae bacterium]